MSEEPDLQSGEPANCSTATKNLFWEDERENGKALVLPDHLLNCQITPPSPGEFSIPLKARSHLNLTDRVHQDLRVLLSTCHQVKEAIRVTSKLDHL